MESTANEVVQELPGLVKVYKDGSVERLMGSPYAPPSPQPDPETGVSSKDITISENPSISARLYLPKLTQTIEKLPILVYFHGGGFCLESAFSLFNQRYLNALVSEAKVIAVSVEYRLAPEHPLPAAYEDCWTALQWVASHSFDNEVEKDPWLLNHGDFDRLFIGGDSAGSLRKYAIAHQFAFKYKKNDSRRVTAKCKVEGCPWRIHASRLSTTELISIKKMHPTHTCGGPAMTGGYQATSSWVASVIKEKLKVFPDYKPKDIVNDIKQEYRIQLNYSQARRGKEIALGQLRGSYKDAYSQLPSLCDRIMETNPGSVATFTTKEDSSFHRLFISFHASLSGFVQGCRPLLFLDSIPLKSKYQGMLLTATAADGDDGVFPVAFAVVDAETNDNWYWFLLQVKSAVSTSCPLTVIADRQKGLRESIPEIFVDSYHGYCLRYLTEELVRELKGQFSHEVKRIMSEDLYRAASAPKPEDFHACVESIKMISLEAYNWVMQSEPKNWANTFFQGARYNHMTSDFGERFYSWASDAHELPITRMVDVIRGKIMELIYTRRADSDHWLTRLTPSMEEKLEKESLKACSFQLRLTTGSIFEVQGDSTEVVDIDRWDCSCKGWQLTGLPCCHAIAVIRCIGQSPYDFCSRYFATESYRLTYAESVQPIPDVDSPMQKDSSQALVTPPPRRPPGQPTTKKVVSQDIMKRQLQCSRCKGFGHNKSTCKELV